MTTLIKNGRVLDPANGIDAVMDIHIVDGKINEVSKQIDCDAQTVIDATGCWVTPGLIDMHVHLREPGFEHKETIATGTRSAAMGGFTTICCMPNTQPVTDSEIVVEYIKLKAARDGVVHVLPIGSITKGQKGEELSNIGKMVEVGICAISEDGKTVENSALMKIALQYAGMFKIPVLAHCEDIKLAGAGQMNAGDMASLLGMRGISNDSEEVIVGRDILLANSVKAKLHLCHLSTKGSVQLLREAKQRGETVTAEVTPHHFTLTEESLAGYDANYKMSPPLRSQKDVDALKHALQDGTIEVIATDHAPHHHDEKNCEFEKAANGIVGLETSVALSITELVHTGFLTPLQLIEKMAYNPAKILGIEKGTLGVGKAADITIINPDETYKICVDDFVSKAKNSPFDGFTVSGKVLYTIVDGSVVVCKGKLKETLA